jgi:hypothetical protein
MALASSANRCHRGVERIVSMKTANANCSSKNYGLDINAWLCGKPAEKPDDCAIIPVSCGFGTFV